MSNTIYDVTRLSDNLKSKIIAYSKSQVIRLQNGFLSDDKFWCKQTYGSMILEALTSFDWLTEEQQKFLLNMYQNLDFK